MSGDGDVDPGGETGRSSLITPAGLATHLASGADVVVLDVRWRLAGPSMRSDYRGGHLPGAVFVDVDTELAGPPDDHGRHPLPSALDFERSMRRAGVSMASTVVAYDARDSSAAAARAWWLLRYFGHPDVRVLDGGLGAWVEAGGTLESGCPEGGPVETATGDFVATPGQLPLLDAAGALVVARDGSLLDARAAERYRGEVEPMDPVAGHIPGARSAPTSLTVDSAGGLLRPTDLRAHFEALGVSASGPVGVYCGSGITAAQQVLALEVAGFDAALYADSWSGWITDPRRPVAVGDGSR